MSDGGSHPRVGTGPRILVVTVPKSGTHLLDSILERMPPLRRQEKAGLNAMLRFHPFNFLPFTGTATCISGIGRPHTVKVSAMKHALGRIRPWRYAMGYIPWQPVVMDILVDLAIRPVVIVRDPRDALVSLMHHVLSRPNHFMHRSLTAQATDHERLVTLMTGTTHAEGPAAAPLARRLEFILGWVEDPSVLTLRFEDLVGSRGGGSDESQVRALMALGTWVGRPVDAREAGRIGQEMFGTGRTFRKGRIGGWRDVFDDGLIARFEREVGNHMRRLRYALD